MAVTAKNVRALKGALERPGVLAGAANVGDVVYVTSTGWAQADGNVNVDVAAGRGILTAISRPGETAGVAGDGCTVVTFGPVSGFSSLTPGKRQFLSNTAGQLTETVPSGALTWTQCMGYAETDGIVFVSVGIAAPVSNT